MTAPLLVRIRIAFGAAIAADPATWVWTDVTPYWHVDDDVEITWGRSPGASQAETSQMALSLKNNDSRFTAFHGASPYWPNVIEWTPIQYDIDLGDGFGWRNRFSGFVVDWAVRWPGGSERMAIARIQAVGILGRLGRGRPPERSAMRRAYTATSPAAYWPLEGPGNVTDTPSGLPGGAALTLSGTGLVKFAGIDGPAGSDQVMDFSSTWAEGTIMSGPVPEVAGVASWRVEWSMIYRTTEAAYQVKMPGWATGGQISYWYTDQNPQASGGFTLHYVDRVTNTTQTLQFFDERNDGQWHLYRLDAFQDGGNIELEVSIDGNLTSSSTIVTRAIGSITRLDAQAGLSSTTPQETGLGHVTVWQPRSLVDTYPAFTGHITEAATTRLARLGTDDNLSVTIPVVDAARVARMGPQPAAAFTELAIQCETADQGLLYESGFGLGYLPRVSRYNPPVTLTIDAALGQLGRDLAPTPKDPSRRNSWTVSRDGGRSETARDEALIAAQGEIEGTTVVNHKDDTQLDGHARWWLRRHRVQEMRYPTLSIDLGAHPELAAAWVACRPGSRMQVANPPKQGSTSVIDQIVTGATEVCKGRRSWRATMNVEPASPWRIAKVGAGARVGSKTAVIAKAAGAGDVSLLVADPAGPWVTTSGFPADFPFDASAAGEQVTVNSITAPLSDDYARTVANGWGNAPTGQAYAVTGTASDYAVAAGVATQLNTAVNSLHAAVIDLGSSDQDFTWDCRLAIGSAVGAEARHWIAARYADANNYYAAVLALTATGTVVLSLARRLAGILSIFPGQAVTVGTGHVGGDTWRVRPQIFGSTFQARAWPASDVEPGQWPVSVTDTAITSGTSIAALSRLEMGNTNTLPVTFTFDNLTVISPQKWTVTRSVNGVTKPQIIGAPVRLWTPYAVGL